LGYSGGTLQATNGLLNYLNNAMEFQAPISHQGAASTTDSGALSPTYSTNNHRSWHPVMDVTGRTIAARGITSPNLWRAPWNGSDVDGGSTIVAAVGTQTMYCSDCHGSQTNLTDGVIPVGGENGNSWGPHGSTENFLLKGEWKTDTVPPVANDTLCFRCHEYSQYADPSATPAPAALPERFRRHRHRHFSCSWLNDQPSPKTCLLRHIRRNRLCSYLADEYPDALHHVPHGNGTWLEKQGIPGQPARLGARTQLDFWRCRSGWRAWWRDCAWPHNIDSRRQRPQGYASTTSYGSHSHRL